MDWFKLGKGESPPEPLSSTFCCTSLFSITEAGIVHCMTVLGRRNPCRKATAMCPQGHSGTVSHCTEHQRTEKVQGHEKRKTGEMDEHLICSHLQSQGDAGITASGTTSSSSALTAFCICLQGNTDLSNCLPSYTWMKGEGKLLGFSQGCPRQQYVLQLESTHQHWSTQEAQTISCALQSCSAYG